MLKRISYLIIALFGILHQEQTFANPSDSVLVLKRTTDFKVNGVGDAKNWESTNWVTLKVQKGPKQDVLGKNLPTRVKILYSNSGVYFLMDCADKKLTATITEDFGTLFKEDVVEVFLWPDTSQPIYLEYEISPLDYELVILVPNIKGKAQGWKPWFYNETNRVQHATSVQGGPKKSMASVQGWKAEFFIPYALMNPIVQTPPTSGTRWRGNFYRIDYDAEPTYYSWQKTSGSFHEFRKFGTLLFE